ncbi:MAG: 2Fe-2S iron-sulfur cluster binding domain-containing protein [Candidatus Hydrogenedentes bacterium]|nr:2Fe-2S iron-sulfur cluster binding domain-containing protein [Candidatus Hydrogenedentota bacterium]
MPSIIFIDHTGKEHHFDAEEGANVMEIAVDNMLPGIDADCGGSCACATCHIYVDEAQLDKLGERSEDEETMLEFAEQLKPNSRLACQLTVFEGLRITMPEQQF